MQATAPLKINGETYDRYSVNLAISVSYKPDGTMDASAAMRLVPTRIGTQDDGNGNQVPAAITAEANALPVYIGSTASITEATTGAAISAIRTALQTYITAKGL